MAKSNALQILNKVQSNLGEVYTGADSFGVISGLALLIFNTMNEVLLEIAENEKLMELESDISIPLVTNISTYTASITLSDFDQDSFNYNDERTIPYYTTQRMDREFPVKTSTGQPRVAWYWAGYFRLYPVPAASESGKFLKFRGWKIPDLYSTSDTSGTSFIPEGLDLTLLANMITFKVLAYKQNPEAQVYYARVYGTSDGKVEGQLNSYRRKHSSPQILDSSIMVEPIGSNRSNGIVQQPITG